MKQICFLIMVWNAAALAQNSKHLALESRGADWPMYNRDLAGTRYSPLAQINTRNVGRLVKAWSFRLDARGSEATPIVIGDVMYLPAGNSVVALDPETGKEIWRYRLEKGMPSRRGVTYWPGDRTNPPRIIFTAGRSMVALNARTGKVDPGFGNEGAVDVEIPYNSAPTLYNNTLFIGANVGEIQVPNAPGDTRAYDVRTGKPMWKFHSVPGARRPRQ